MVTLIPVVPNQPLFSVGSNLILMEHGLRNTYTNGGCRCEPCRAAATEYIRAWRAARRQQTPEETATQKEHGTLRAARTCRCDPCRAAITPTYRR